MKAENKSHGLTKELRIALTPEAAQVYDKMVARLKEDMPTIKLYPSQVVSFLVIDFFTAYFEKDKDVFIAEFFDSDAYYESARKKAKGAPNYEDLMAKAMAEAKAIKTKKRRQIAAKINKPAKADEGLTS